MLAAILRDRRLAQKTYVWSNIQQTVVVRLWQGYSVSAAPLFLWSYMSCYSSMTFGENEAENQYLCHSKSERREREVQLTCNPYVSMTVGRCFICKAKRKDPSRLNYRLELPLQLRRFNRESSLLRSTTQTITLVQGLVTLQTSL